MSGSLPIPRYSKGLGDRPNMGAPQSARNSRPDVRIQPRAARQVLEESDATLTRLRKHDAETRSHHGISVHVGEEGEEREGFAQGAGRLRLWSGRSL